MNRSAVIVAVLAAGIVLSLAGPASAAAPVTAQQGGSVTLSGTTTCPANVPIQVSSSAALFPPNGTGPTAQRGTGGSFQDTFTVPASTPPGSYTITVTCDGTTSQETLNVTEAPATISLAVSPTSGQPGASVTISGVLSPTGTGSCASGDSVQLTSSAALFPPNGLGPQAGRDATGHFSTTATIPAGAAAGKYTIGMRCGGGTANVTASLLVVAPTTTTTAAPTTTTTIPSATTTTLAPTTTPPAATTTTTTTTATIAHKSNAAGNWRWVGAAALVLALLVAVFVATWHRGG